MRTFWILGVLVAAVGTVGCMGAGESGAWGDDDDGSWSAGDGDGDVDSGADGDADGDEGGDPADVVGGGGAGTLTAGAWDDNRNFAHFQAFRTTVRGQVSGAPPFSDDEVGEAHALFEQDATARTNLEVSLVIDTTGSMGDEMRYLKAEYVALTSAIAERFPDASQRWSLVVYRDEGDMYVTQSFDFQTDVQGFRTLLDRQDAGGGGDFPEAPEQALARMSELSWSTDADTARIAFWVADAPHHDRNAEAMAQAVRTAQAKGIHVYPVASSGIDSLMELTMRMAAQLTGGRYLFLTDDSGVGGAHAEPTIPCYFVTKLNDAVLRMVEIELSGVYREPAADEIIRTGGNPEHGACTLESGETVNAY